MKGLGLRSRPHEYFCCRKCGRIFTHKANKDEHEILCDGKRIR